MLATYVRFYTVGKLLKEKKVLNRSIYGLEIPENAYGFVFIEREEYEANGNIYYDKFKNLSKRYFLSKEFEGIKKIPKEALKIRNMNLQKRILKNSVKQYTTNEDVVIVLP